MSRLCRVSKIGSVLKYAGFYALVAAFFVPQLMTVAVAVAPPDWWMRVERITVLSRERPILVEMERTVYRDMTGDWFAEVHQVGGGQACWGSGRAVYERRESRILRMTFENYIGHSCELAPGTYIIRVSWRMMDISGVTKLIRATSESFIVEGR